MLRLYVIVNFFFILVALCLYCEAGSVYSDLGNVFIIYVDCNNGSDTTNCGLLPNTSCKTLLFVISQRLLQSKSSNVEIDIAHGECKESGVLRFNGVEVNVTNWSFTGSTESSNPPTIVYFSVECFDSAISFSHLTWQSSSGPGTSFNIRSSEVSFWHCTFENLNFHFTGLSLNLFIQNMTIRNCSSQNKHLPLFFMQVLSYSYDTTIFIQNSTFSNNRSPIMYALQFHQIHLENVLFLKNGRDLINMPMLTVSGSSVIIEKSLFSLNLGTAINVKNVGKFRVSKVQFLSNNVLNGSCLVVKRHSNVSLVDTIFKQNTNPVVFLKDGDGVQVLLKNCSFGCVHHGDKNVPLVKNTAGSNITVTKDCNVTNSCSVYCSNGERVKYNLYCQKCQPGSFSYDENNAILSDSCERCPEGTYTSSDGGTNCIPCGEGTYADKTGSTSCKKCTNDFLTSDAGAKGCYKMTLEMILVVAATTPLIFIPLILLVSRILKYRGSKLKARLRCGKTYNRLGQNVTINAVKEVLSQGPYKSY